MLAWITLAFGADIAELHVGVPRHAGTTADVVVEGASGPCQREPARVRCPAEGPVRWSWPDVTFTWYGDAVTNPGQRGVAWVLAADAGGAADRVRALTLEPIDGHDLLQLREILVPTSGWVVPWPDPPLLRAHVALLEHADARVRREAIEGLHPWIAGTPFDALPVDAPIILAPGALESLGEDSDPGVRKRWIRMLRAARPGVPGDLVRRGVLARVDDPHPGVRRAAIASLPDLVYLRRMSVEEAWSLAVRHLGPDIPVGRAACDTLSRLAAVATQQGVSVNAEEAMDRILRVHPERGWRFAAAWGDTLPAREDWMRVLLWDTLGYDAAVVRRWGASNPDALARSVEAWPPGPYAERRAWVERDRAPRASDDILSTPSPPPAAPPDPD